MSGGALLVWFATLWLYGGGAVAVAFLLFGIDRVDANSRGAYIFRPLLVPGVVLLWPLVLWRWLALEAGAGNRDVAKRYRALRTSHARVWAVLGFVIPAILIGSLLVRQAQPSAKGAAVRLDTSGSAQ